MLLPEHASASEGKCNAVSLCAVGVSSLLRALSSSFIMRVISSTLESFQNPCLSVGMRLCDEL